MSKTKNNTAESVDPKELREMLAQLNGITGQSKPAPADKTYHLFSEGPLAGLGFRRVPNPSVGLQKKVDKVRLQSTETAPGVRRAICEHWKWGEETVEEVVDTREEDGERVIVKEVTVTYGEDVEADRLSFEQTMERLIPLMVASAEGDNPNILDEGFDTNHASTKAYKELYNDFLLDT